MCAAQTCADSKLELADVIQMQFSLSTLIVGVIYEYTVRARLLIISACM